MNKSTAILVLSCDKYAAIWQTFFDFFFKYWNDCPFPVYLGTNRAKFNYPKVTQLFSYRNTTWSDELAVILNQIKEENVILILEDYFIYEKVNSNDIYKCIDILNSQNAAYIKLACFPKQYDSLWRSKPLANVSGYGEIEKGNTYRVCLQVALWKKDILVSLLNPTENPWQFEIEASKRTTELEQPFLRVLSDPSKKYVHGPITYYCTALSAGKWMRGALKLCRENNINANISSFPIESRLHTLKRHLYIGSPLILRKVFNFIGSRLSKLKLCL